MEWFIYHFDLTEVWRILLIAFVGDKIRDLVTRPDLP